EWLHIAAEFALFRRELAEESEAALVHVEVSICAEKVVETDPVHVAKLRVEIEGGLFFERIETHIHPECAAVSPCRGPQRSRQRGGAVVHVREIVRHHGDICQGHIYRGPVEGIEVMNAAVDDLEPV